MAAPLYTQLFPAEQPAAAAVVIATGIHQHVALYEGFATRLASEGFPVLCYDHRGFGRSPSYEGCERSMIPEWHDLEGPSATGDLRRMVILAQQEFGVERVFVFGHSLGGLAAGLLATSGASPAAGFILSNPSLQNPWASMVDELESKPPTEPGGFFAGDVQRGASNNAAFLELWNGPEVSAHIEPGRPFKYGYMLAANFAIDVVRARFDQFTGPALVLRGEADAFEQGACADLIAGASGARLTLRSYEGMAHELIFEDGLAMGPGENRVVDEIVAWLKEA